MSVKYIDNMKTSRGVHARWAELIGSYSFTISHARVIVEDCVSRCPSHLPEPTQEELDMEKDWEANPPPHLDLEKLAIESAQLPARPEQICQTHGDSIQMNMMFDNGKVRIGWERPDEDDGPQQDWTEQLESTITELHQDTEEEPGIWVHDWGWTQTANQPKSHKDHINKVKIFYSEDESEVDDVKIFYSEDEKELGAADEEDDEDSSNSEEEDQTPQKPEPRRSGRLWAPTQQTLESQGQQWDFQRTGHREGFSTTQPHLPPERQQIDQESESDDPAPMEGQLVRAPTVEVGQDDLNLELAPEDDLDNLVLEPALDH